MAKLVNLKQVRKIRKRKEERKIADENAAVHGLTKLQKNAAKNLSDRQSQFLDDHKRDT